MFAVVNKWKLRWQRHGFWGLLRQAYSAGKLVVSVKARPSYIVKQIKLRIDEREFDRKHGTDTCGYIHAANLAIDSPNLIHAVGYKATAPNVFSDAISKLSFDPKRFVFLDYGSGKGRVLLLAAQFPFKKIVGIEISPVLHRIAQRNIAVAKVKKCDDISLLNLDVEAFEPPLDDPLFCYFYNPFGAKVMSGVLASIKKSLDQYPRDVWIMYNNVVEPAVLDDADWLVPVGIIGSFQIWKYQVSK